jgi:hypothetical protein
MIPYANRKNPAVQKHPYQHRARFFVFDLLYDLHSKLQYVPDFFGRGDEQFPRIYGPVDRPGENEHTDLHPKYEQHIGLGAEQR